MIRTSPQKIRGVIAALIVVAALSGCAQPEPDATGSGGAPRTTEGRGQNAKQTLTLTTAESELGEIVVDEAGMTVYVFDNDTPGRQSTCYDDCMAMWPPVNTSDIPTGEDIDADVGAITRTDGSDQATINGWPLYYYAEDEEPGDVNGQGVGGIWWVVDPNGDRIADAEY